MKKRMTMADANQGTPAMASTGATEQNRAGRRDQSGDRKGSKYRRRNVKRGDGCAGRTGKDAGALRLEMDASDGIHLMQLRRTTEMQEQDRPSRPTQSLRG
jgi:hypothetical protein